MPYKFSTMTFMVNLLNYIHNVSLKCLDSKGSIGVLTNEGDLFCGDLIYNFAGFSYIDNLEDFNESINKLKKLDINILYPGHGKPFSINYFNKKFV